LSGVTPTAADNNLLDALIAAVSAAIERWCKREFAARQYDELYSGRGAVRLALRRYPVISVERVAYGPEIVLTVTNTSASNQRATVQVTSTGLTLVRVASGVTSSDASVTFAANVTLSAVATAVNALGNGWSASVVDSAYNNRASADLRAIQGALNAKDVRAGLKLHLMELNAYEVDSSRGWLLRAGITLEGEEQVWEGGANYWRVIYTAGYASVPDDVQEACAEWVAHLFWQARRDPGMAQAAYPGAQSYGLFKDMIPGVQALLRPYRRHVIAMEN